MDFRTIWVPGSSGGGGMIGFDAATAGLVEEKIKFLSGGAVDAQAVTRIMPILPTYYPFYSRARIRVTWDDYWFAYSRGNDIGLVLVISPDYFGDTPPSNAIELVWGSASGGRYYVSSSFSWVSSNPPGLGETRDFSWTVLGESNIAAGLLPGAKYWAMLLPAEVRLVNGVRTFQGLLESHTNSGADATWRAVSFWTNRAPEAPIITSPASSQLFNAGSTFSLSIDPRDPDEVYGVDSVWYQDLAGVEIQYSPVPTETNPSPAWQDLKFADASGVLRPGWWIDRSSVYTHTNGAQRLWSTGTAEILAGSNSTEAWKGQLPSGTWRIRVRAFDYGHPLPLQYGPLGALNGYSISDLVAAGLASPWSDPVLVTVTAQVPPPIPVFPINNAATVEGTNVSLTWQYRNTSEPPLPQGKRSVQIRALGEETWFDLVVEQPSGDQSILVSGFPLVSGNAYEWRVKVWDTSDTESNWSEIATFWSVPAPASGGTRPLPSETTDGATLGCGTHRVFVYRRGGKERVGEIRNLSYVDWHRVRDDVSTARVKVSGWDIDCGNLLAMLQPWAYELVIIRDNGYSQDRVWEGPITLLTYERNEVVINAKDVMYYAYRRIIRQKMSDAGRGNGATVVSRASRILQNVFAPDDPNILSYLHPITSANDAMQYRSTPAFSRTAFEEVDDMASNAGLDYTTVGRSILLWSTRNRVGTLPEFRDADLGAPPVVSVYGASMANVYSVSDGNGIWGVATAQGSGVETPDGVTVIGTDPIYGLVEMLSSSWASDSDPASGTYTQEGVEKLRESFAEYSERSIADRYPPPVVVRVPDNTTLSPDAVISIQHLVPGVAIPLRSDGTLRSVSALQKLDSVKVVEESGKEKISISMSPFSRDDASMDEGGEE